MSIPVEFLIFSVFGILIYSGCLKGTPIFDDMEVLPQAWGYVWDWKVIRESSRPLASFLMACQLQWARLLKEVDRSIPVWMSPEAPYLLFSVHLSSVLIHSFNGFLVSRIALALGGDPIVSFVAGLFFVAAPLAANTVGYMAGQSGLLVGMFGLLGVWAILAGWGVFCLPCLVCAYLCKEDGLAFALTFILLAAWRGEWLIGAVILAVMSVGAIHQRKHLFTRILKRTGDEEMSISGLPVSLPQPQHGFTVLVETLWRLPFWFFGAKQSPYHGSGMEVPRWTKTLAAIAVLLASFILIYRG